MWQWSEEGQVSKSYFFVIREMAGEKDQCHGLSALGHGRVDIVVLGRGGARDTVVVGGGGTRERKIHISSPSFHLHT